MKRLTVALFGALALSAFAEIKPLGYVQIASPAKLSAAAAKFGETIGQPMIGMMAGAQLGQLEICKTFGTMRPEDSALFVICGDEALLKNPSGETLEKLEAAIVYPLSRGKDEIVKGWTDCTSSNGVYHVENLVPGDFLLDDFYAAFSADGKFVSICDKREYVLPALQVRAKRPIREALVRLCVADGVLGQVLTEENLAKLTKACAEKEELSDDTDVKQLLEQACKILWSVEGAELEIAYSDKGLDFSYAVAAKKDGELSKYGKQALSKSAFDFASANSVLVSAAAPGAGCRSLGVKELEALFVRHGMNVRGVTVEGDARESKVTVDVPALVSYLQGASTNELSKVDPMAFVKDLQGLQRKLQAKPFNAERAAFSIGLKGLSVGKSSALMEKLLPELKTMKSAPFTAVLFLPCAAAKHVLPTVVDSLDESEKAVLTPILAQMPDAKDGGIAGIAWREGDVFRSLVRLSNGELKAIGSFVNLAMAYQMSSAMGESLDFDDDDDDDDGDDGDDDGE